MNIERLPVELNRIIDSYCFERCKYCNNLTTNFDFCSVICCRKYNAEVIEFIDFLIILISLGFVLYNFIDYIIEPLNIMIIVFLYFILIPSWIISNVHIMARGILPQRSLKIN